MAVSTGTTIFVFIAVAVIVSAVVVICKPWSSSNINNNTNSNNNKNNNGGEKNDEKPDNNGDINNLTKPKQPSDSISPRVGSSVAPSVAPSISPKNKKLTEIENKIELFYNKEYKLSANDILKSKALDEHFADLTQVNNLSKICVLGINLLRNYLHDTTKKDYLNITGDIIKRVLQKTESLKEDKTLVDDEWELYIVDIPHLMAMYDLIVQDDSLNILTKCHEYINRVITSDLESTYTGPASKINFVKIGTPYFLTNYKRSLNNDATCKNLYEKATNNTNLALLNKYLMYETTAEVIKQYGVLRKDGGAMLENNIVNYSKYMELIDNIKYPDFYAAVYETLDIPGNLYRSAQVILDKILHNKVSNLPFGLFSLDCKLLKKKHYWNLGNPNGITLLPSIGVGIYKTDKFMFAVRVQQKDIPICFINDSSNPFDFEASSKQHDPTVSYAIGVMQLRTMYLAEKDNYDGIDLSNWENLKFEPGIITTEEDDNCLKLEPPDNNLYSWKKIDDHANNNNNCVGQIAEENLMFWKNHYKLSLKFNVYVSVQEFGVVYKNGITIKYQITGNDPTKNKFHYGFNNKNSSYFKSLIENYDSSRIWVDNPDSYHFQYNPSEPQFFEWNMRLKGKHRNITLERSSLWSTHEIVTCGTKKYDIIFNHIGYTITLLE